MNRYFQQRISRTLASLILLLLAACAPDPYSERESGSASSPSSSAESIVSIPGGTFEMGSSPEEIKAAMARYGIDWRGLFLPETPRHSVQVIAFGMDRYPVTNEQFQEFLQENPEWKSSRLSPAMHNGEYLAQWNGDEPPESLARVPVVFVTWHAAEAYCRWQGGHLPTEAQWEWAARGGLEDPEFRWGDQAPSDELANWGGNEINHAVPVGRYPPNGYGLYDMAGNVWEFCLDEWDEQAYEKKDRPGDIFNQEIDFRQVETRRVIRGGSWGAAAVNMRITYRDSHPPKEAGDHVGFRCVH